MEKRLTKGDKVLCGVCSGVANYLEIDPTIVRIIWFIVTFAYGFGLLAYIAGALLMPEK